MISRRHLLSFVCVGVVTARFTEAQTVGRIPRIGWLTNSVVHDENVHAFRDGMRALGYETVAIEFRAADGQMERVPSLALELTRLKLDVVVVDGGAAAIVAKRVIADLPIVVGAMGDAVGDGIVPSLARPGGNITGFSISTGAELNGKRLDLLREAVPGLARLGILWNEDNLPSRPGVEYVTGAARARGIDVVAFAVRDAAGIARAVPDAARTRVGAVLTIAVAFLRAPRQHIVPLAARHRLPGIYPEPEFAVAGGLLAYGPNVPDNFRRSAGYVDKILKGTKPAELPVEQPKAFVLA